jgi:two-component system KDP operon response regulator KdpE
MIFLIVDDDLSMVDAVKIGLQFEWQDAEVHCAQDGEEGLRKFFELNPDITLLDLKLPQMSGFELLKHIRSVSSAPVLLLTARGEEMSKVKGLEMGADDYLVKPFSHLELFARIKAVLRRTQFPPVVGDLPPVAPGEIEMKYARSEVVINGKNVELTPTEYKLLYHLVSSAGRVLTSETLLARVWGEEHRREFDYLKTYINRLRKKLGDSAKEPRYILTERLVGYRFALLSSPPERDEDPP